MRNKIFLIISLVLTLALVPMGVAASPNSSPDKPQVTSAAASYLERQHKVQDGVPGGISRKTGIPEPEAVPALSPDEVKNAQGNFKADENGKLTIIIDCPSKPLAAQLNEKGASIQAADAIKVQLEAEHNQALNQLGQAGINFEVKHTYAIAYNGLAIRIAKNDLDKVQKIFGVDQVHPTKTYYLDMAYSTVLTGATTVWTNLGYKGEGMVVGVVDTGVDYNHPDLGGGFGNKVIRMIDVADQDNDAMDENGHGTHVAGIMAAKAAEPGGVTGMAPEAKIIAAKIVKGGEGSATSADIAAAFDWMLQQKLEGVNLASINMSFGFPGGWNNPTDPEQVAIQNCVDSGIFVSLSAGNEYWGVYPSNQVYYYGEQPGRFTYYPADISTVGSPATTPGPASVAASWNTFSRYPSFLEVSGSKRIGYALGSPSPDPEDVFGTSAQLEYVYCGLGGSPSDFPPSVAGRIALIERGTYTFLTKVTNAQNAGAIGVIVYNSASGGDTFVTMALDSSVTIPAVFVRRSDGLYLKGLTSPPAKVQFDGQLTDVPNALADKMVDFSSWGTDPNLNFKPEITAPGGGIWSTVPLAMGGYDNYSGTSMASPHVGGAAALIMQAHPDWTPAQVKAALMNTATLLTDPTTGLPYSPRLQGAGRINVYNALLTPVFVADNTTDYPAEPLGDTDSATSKSFTLKLTNTGTEAITYNLSATIQRYSSGRVPYTLSGGSVTFPGGTSVTVPAGGTALVNVTVSVAGNTTYENIFVDGFVMFTPQGATVPELHVPYTLFWGDWQDTRYTDSWAHNPVIDPPQDDPTGWWWWGYTWPCWGLGNTLYFLGVDFNGNLDRNIIAISPNSDGIQDNIWPLISLMRGAKNLTFAIYDQNGNLVKTIANERYVHKNFSRYPYWTGWDFDWMWEPAPGELPDGHYILKYQAAVPATLNGPTTGYDVQEFPLIVDTVDPILEITSITHGPGSTHVEWSASDDNSGLYGFLIYADGQPIEWVDPSTTSYDIPFEASEIVVQAWDNAGNTSPRTGDVEVAFSIPATQTYDTTFVVSFLDPGTNSVLHNYTLSVPSDSGSFTVYGVLQGTYDIKVKEAQCLSVLFPEVEATGTVSLDAGALKLGDITGDDYINIYDFSILAGSYGKTSSDPGFDAQADLNHDNVVNIYDFSILAGNYGLAGPM
ncbi:MAG: S8 family serine peptidase [Coprothermobacterota bacterium]|nr:S8 family serine peptidase [Coprothermobacterota bacterium]